MKNVSDGLIFGFIGFFIGGILGWCIAGSTCAKVYRKRILELEHENRELFEENEKAVEKGLVDREEDLRKAEEKIDKNLSSIGKVNAKKAKKMSTNDIEKLSEEYGSDAFNAHFADRVAPDDSDEDYEDDSSDASEYVGVGEEAERGDDIRIMDEEEFKKDLPYRDCDNYTFYQEEGVLVNDSTREVERDQEGILGEEGMEIIADTEKDFIYIDNEPDDMLYEISVEHNLSYYRDVLGY